MLKITRFISILVLFLAYTATANSGSLEDGHTAFDAKQYKKAFEIWKPLSDKGDPDAQYNLALLYMNGLGVEKNDRLALKLFTLAAQQGMADAQYNAGVMFYTGKGVYPNQKTAVAWWELAAAKGHPNAQNNLAGMYAFGYGVGKDVNKAIKWWQAAAEQGHPDAINSLIHAYKGSIPGIKADPAKAEHWFNKKK